MVEYVAADPFLDLAKAAVSQTSYKYISPIALDLSRDPEEQGFKPCSFDIVIGFNSLHPLPNIAASVTYLNRLLVPGGALLLAELDGNSWREKPGSIWIDTVFGTFPEWFSFTDGREHTPLPSDAWKTLLSENNYEEVHMMGREDGGLGFIIAAVTSLSQTSTSNRSKHVFLPYRYGEEMALQSQLASFDVNQPLSMWLIAEDGIDGHAGIGLVLSIVREFASWDIRLAIFESSLGQSEQIETILRFCDLLGDTSVVKFTKEGKPLVPKAVRSLPPPPATNFDPTGSWVSNGSDLRQIHLEPLKEYEVLVDISAWSNPACSFRGFVGSIVDSRDDSFIVGQKVVGVCTSPLANQIICPSGNLASLDDLEDGSHLAEFALAIVISTLALGSSARASTSRRKRPTIQVHVADADHSSQAVMGFLKSLPSLATVIEGHPTDEERLDVIIASSQTIAKRPEVSSLRGKLFIWDSVIRDMIESDPWLLGQTLECGMKLATPEIGFGGIIYTEDIIAQSLKTLVPNQLPLFDRAKAYVLIGGVSDLGIHVAIWMYRVSAEFYKPEFP